MNARNLYWFTSGLLSLLLTTSAVGQVLPTDIPPQLAQPPRRAEASLTIEPARLRTSVAAQAPLCNRAAIIADYTTNFLGTSVTTTELGWTGSVSGCLAGSISTIAQTRTLQRINYYRRLAGVTDNITLDLSRDAATQEAALMMKANNGLNHAPPTSWLCYTTAGGTAAGSSLLAFGSHSAQSVKQFMDDLGAGNEVVGHRRWLLYPQQSSVGHGSTDITDIIWVFNTFVTPASVPPFVAFPSAGYVPRDLISSRWSFSIPNADFSASTVTITNEAGTALARTQYAPSNGYGDNTLVWDMTNASTDLAWSGPADQVFTVRVAGVKIGSSTQPDYVYRVIAIDPTPPTLSLATANPTCGTSLNNGSIMATFDRGAKAYLWSTGATTQAVSNLGPGSYTVTVTDKNDCTYSQSVTLSNTRANIPAITSSSPEVCAGNVVSLTATNCAGTLTWSDGLGTGSVKSVTPAITTVYGVTCAESACISTTAAATVSVTGPLPAQCSVVASAGTSVYYGVERFMLNTIDASSSSSFNDGANYINRACAFSTTVTPGTSYTVLVKGYFTNSHRARVYIDYNNNGLFTDPGETVLTGTGNSVTATVPIPITAVQNVPLRVRVVADPSSSVSPCSLPGAGSFGSGQAEDYALTIAPLVVYVPPTIPVLVASTTLVCAGSMVSLSATNCNGTLNWSGGLGNGTSKSVMPMVSTTYSVSCGQTGWASTTASVTVSVRPSPLLTASCNVSAGSGPSNSVGIERFVFGGIDLSSSPTLDGGSNYLNRTCDVNSGSVTAGGSYTALVKGYGTTAHQLRLYMDFNNNGSFSDPGELVLTGASNSMTAAIAIPATAVLNVPLRVRVVADAVSATGVSACFLPGSPGLGSGQAEDYGLTIIPAVVPVLTASTTLVCAGSMVSLSATNCTGILNWSNGLGSGTSKSVMPTVSTTYSVSCVQGGGASTTASVVVLVNVAGPGLALCSVSALNGSSSIFGIERIVFSTIDMASSATADAGANYINRACAVSTTVTAGQSYSMLVKGNGTAIHQSLVYIDYNNNGVFTDPGETVLTGVGNSVTATVPIPVTALTNTLLRIRVVADASSASGISACLLPGISGSGSGQAEDYALWILTAPVPPPTIPVLVASTTLVCAGSTVSLSATNCNGTLNWSGGLGNGTSKSVMPMVSTTYSVSCGQTGWASTTASVTVSVRPVPIPAQCSVSATNGLSPYFGVELFAFNSIVVSSSTSGAIGEGNYVNRTCEVSTTVTAGLSYTAIVKGMFGYTHRCQMYIDYDNNGLFTDPGETVLSATSNSSVITTVLIPTTALQNTPLRMRVVADPSPDVSSCSLPGRATFGSGQAEDYTLVVIPNLCPTLVTGKDGNWNDPTVWSCNRIPTASEPVQVDHVITVPAGVSATARTITFGPNGRLIYATNARSFLND